jgi:hypothetical protein
VVACLLIEGRYDWRKLFITATPAMLVFVVQWKWFQDYPDSLLMRYSALRAQCGLPLLRPDYLDTLHTAYATRMKLYFSAEQERQFFPQVMAIAAFVGYAAGSTAGTRPWYRLTVGVLCAAASAAPLLLGFAGWDTNRWLMMAAINPVVILLIASSVGRYTPSMTSRLPVIACFALLACTLHVDFFEVKERPLSHEGVTALASYFASDIRHPPAR